MELINFLIQEDVLEAFLIEYFKNVRKGNIVLRPFRYIRTSFDWNNTPQGVKYWGNLHSKYIMYQTENDERNHQNNGKKYRENNNLIWQPRFYEQYDSDRAMSKTCWSKDPYLHKR